MIFMNSKKSQQHGQRTMEDLLCGPAYNRSGHEVFRTLKKMIDRVECSQGQQLEQRQFAHLLGVPKSTAHDWFHGKLATALQSFLCAFERLPETDRILFLREFCRLCPRLEHPRLAHDVETSDRLRLCVEQRAGLTILNGAEEPRTFLVTAMGHSISRVDPKRTALGLDVHRPRSFVPVAGVHYCQQPPNRDQVSRLAGAIMERCKASNAEVLILNGVWSGVSLLPALLRQLSATRHVIAADDFGASLDPVTRLGLRPVHVLKVSVIPGRQALIHVEF
jgi:hypothetical protein